MKKEIRWLLLAVIVLGFTGAALIFFVRKDCVIGSSFELINTPFWARPFCREEYDSIINRGVVVVTLGEGASSVDFSRRHEAIVDRIKGPYEERVYQIYFKKGVDYDTALKRFREDPAVESVRPVALKHAL